MRYHGIGGIDRMEFDLEIAVEISTQVADAAGRNDNKPKGGVKAMVARREQRRAAALQQRITNDEALNMLTGKDNN